MSSIVEPSPAHEEVASPVPFARTRRLAGPVALGVGGVAALAGMSLHIKGGAEDVHFVRAVNAEPTEWLISHLMMGFGWALFAAGILTVLRLVGRRGVWLTGTAVVMASVGATITALGDISHGALAFALADEVSAAKSLEIQKVYFAEPALLALASGGMLVPLSFLLLGAGLLRARAVPVWLAVTLLVSPVLIQTGYSSDLPLAPFMVPMTVGIAMLARAVAAAPVRAW